MGEVPVSLHLSQQLADDLAREADLKNLSVDEIAQSALSTYLDWQAEERELLRERIKEADKGVFVSSDAVLAWMERLAEDDQARFPEADIFLPPKP